MNGPLNVRFKLEICVELWVVLWRAENKHVWQLMMSRTTLAAIISVYLGCWTFNAFSFSLSHLAPIYLIANIEKVLGKFTPFPRTFQRVKPIFSAGGVEVAPK